MNDPGQMDDNNPQKEVYDPIPPEGDFLELNDLL